MVHNLKKIKLLLYIFTASLTLQLISFYLLDSKAEQLLNPLFRFDKPCLLNVDLSNSLCYNLSYNNRFLAFISDDSLNVVDLINNSIIFNSLSSENNSILLGYQWFPDRNSLIYLVQEVNDISRPILLYSLDFDTLQTNSNMNFEPRLNRVFSFPTQKILKIELSTYTNNLFLLLQDKNQKTELIKMDIMKNINRLHQVEEFIVSISVSNKFGVLYVESIHEANKKIYSIIGGERSIISDNTNDILLGCYDDVVFIGKTNDDMLQEIYLYPVGQEYNNNKVLFWRGNISLKDTNAYISADKKILLKGSQRLDILYPDGKHDTKKISNSIIVLSSSGKMYLEIVPSANRWRYYWRSI